MDVRIHTIRNSQVILDSDLAKLYKVQTRDLNKAVNRNNKKFPNDFCFRLTHKEFENLMFHFGTSNWGGKRKLPYVFTEHGVIAVAGVLKSKTAATVSIQIVREFIQMRQLLTKQANLLQKFQQIDQKLLTHDAQLQELFTALERKQLTTNQGIFYEGQLFQAHSFIISLIKQAKETIILIDNYVNEETLTLLSHKDSQVNLVIYTREITSKLKLLKDKFNTEFGKLDIRVFDKSHDRFVIIDSETYHFGASLKDAGKKWFAFTKMKEISLIDKLKEVTLQKI